MKANLAAELDLFAVEVYVAGVDEAGRGPLVGAVYAAAVILDPNKPIAGLRDSKKLSETKRDALAILIKENAYAWAIASASAAEIDQLNILEATMLAMSRAVQALHTTPTEVLIDGNRVPRQIQLPARAIVKGDDKEACISAASILAKTARDASLVVLDAEYPQYGFKQHKGYPTAAHLAALERFGAIAQHRRSYKPVQKVLQLGQLNLLES